jgi:hypothetical protein
VAKKGFATALTQRVIAGLDPPIHVADKSAWTTGSNSVTKTKCRKARTKQSGPKWRERGAMLFYAAPGLKHAERRMANDQQLAYVARAIDRLRDTCVIDAQMSRQRIVAEGTRVGLGGRTLLQIKEEYVRVVSEAVSKVARLAFDSTGSNEEAVFKTIQRGLFALRDGVSNDLADFFRKTPWASGVGDALGNDFLISTDRAISAGLDDFSHGILEGVRLMKDPIVSVVSTVNNSPGAVVQTGLGNVQKVLSVNGRADVRSALTSFLSSKEVQALAPDDRQGLEDLADVLTAELEKASPDTSKLARWGKRLLEVAEKLGVAVAASGLGHLLFG